MNIQKEIELHENWYKQDDPVSYQWYLGGCPEYIQDFGQSEKSWLAAKSSAVPKGFVLVPKEPTEEMLGAAWEAPPAGGPSGNRRIFYEKQSVVYKAMVDEAVKEMTTAQEQNHDH